MPKIYVDGSNPLLRSLVSATFPDYTGKKFAIDTAETVNVKSYWDGGSRDYYSVARILPDGTVIATEIPQMSQFDPQYVGADRVPTNAMENMVIVKHSFFCGKDMGITFIVHPSLITAGLLPSAPTSDLSENERKVLYYTRSLKSSYAGIKNYRQSQSGMSPDAWEAAKSALIAKGLLNKAGALTLAGKNAAQGLRY